MFYYTAEKTSNIFKDIFSAYSNYFFYLFIMKVECDLVFEDFILVIQYFFDSFIREFKEK